MYVCIYVNNLSKKNRVKDFYIEEIPNNEM